MTKTATDFRAEAAAIINGSANNGAFSAGDANSTPTVKKEEEFYLNIGRRVTVEDPENPGSTLDILCNIPAVISLSTIKARVVRGNNVLNNQKAEVGNKLLERLQEAMLTLQPGDTLPLKPFDAEIYRRVLPGTEGTEANGDTNPLMAQVDFDDLI